MRILIEAHHPSDIHFFKWAIARWQDAGHSVLLLGRERDVMKQLLQAYSWIRTRVVTQAGPSNQFPLREMVRRQISVAHAIRTFDPNVVLSLMGSYTQMSAFLRRPNLVFTDSEHQRFSQGISLPFATRIYTPQCYWKDHGRKHRRYLGYHELAFLHPNHFRPRTEVLDRLNGAEPGGYAILRTSAWNTLHDIGRRGIGNSIEPLLDELTQRIPVFIVPEGGALPSGYEHLRLQIEPHWYHDALAFAGLVISEGASTASESACLGVPTVYISPTRLGYLEDQERRYGLVYNFTDPQRAIAQATRLLDHPKPRAHWEEMRNRLIEDHIDVTDFLVGEVEAFA